MNNRKGFNRLERTSSHRKALHKSMATALFRHERIRTTSAKAKEVRRTAEKLITRARTDTVHNRREVAKKIADNKLSVRQSEKLVKALRNKKNLKVVPSKDSNILNLEKSLEDKIGLGVEIKNKKDNSGTLSFMYKNLDQLDRLINTIKKNY